MNCLQGYFETNFSIDNCEHVAVTPEIMDDLRAQAHASLQILVNALVTPEQRELVTRLAQTDAEEVHITDAENTVLENLTDSWHDIDAGTLPLPPCDGFFYGRTAIDRYYFEDLTEVLRFCRIVEDVYGNLDEDSDEYVVYTCWY